MNKLISRRDAAILVGVSVSTILRWDAVGRIPAPTIFIDTEDSRKKVAHYDRVEFEKWAATNPVNHPGFKDIEKRRKNTKVKKIKVEEDIWNVRTKKENFCYSGHIKNHILFCKNMLLSRNNFDVSGDI